MFEPGSSFSSVINERVVNDLAARILIHDKNFDSKNFIKECDFSGLKFGARILVVKEALKKYLTNDKKRNCEILVKALPLEISTANAGQSSWDNFIMMPMGEYVADVALLSPLSKSDLKFYLNILKEMTKSLSSESAIRHFILKYPKETMEFLYKCTKDKNVHVRRLACEGCRPRLPLSFPIPAFKKDPTPVIKILEALKDDEHDYVYRSVANNLNDIGKDNPKIVTTLLSKWKKGSNKNRDWVIKHALRSLIKKGNLDALKILGIKKMDYTLSKVVHAKKIKKGTPLEFSFTLKNIGTPGDFIIDYVIDFQKKSGVKSKVFKLTKTHLKKGEAKSFTGKLMMKDLSTRKLFLGSHAISLQVNGERSSKTLFELFA